jgi:hypothetical protein
MHNSLGEFAAITVVFLMFAIPAFFLVGKEKGRAIAPPIQLHELRGQMALSGTRIWNVTILRRSGYAQDGWDFHGNAVAALQTAESKMRQASLTDFVIRSNNQMKFEVRAYYESSGKRRTGKYIGGFVITPV